MCSLLSGAAASTAEQLHETVITTVNIKIATVSTTSTTTTTAAAATTASVALYSCAANAAYQNKITVCYAVRIARFTVYSVAESYGITALILQHA
jgi:hypothetical protein